MMDYPVLTCFSLEIFNGDFDENLKTKTKMKPKSTCYCL